MRTCDTVVKHPFITCITPKDNRVTTFYTLWPTPSLTIARNSSVHDHIHMRIPMVPNYEAEMLNFHGMCKEINIERYKLWTGVEVPGHFTKCGPPWII